MTDITTWKAALALPVSPRRDHIRGAVDAPLVLVEYGDYECCYCAAAHHVVAAIERQLADQLAFVFRHFPLVTLHHYAETAAEAAEAAGAQGKFWPMDDLLYQNQQRLAPPDLIAYAGALGLDIGRFNAELARNIHAIKVREVS
jgi:protein-disulfide isomerase